MSETSPVGRLVLVPAGAGDAADQQPEAFQTPGMTVAVPHTIFDAIRHHPEPGSDSQVVNAPVTIGLFRVDEEALNEQVAEEIRQEQAGYAAPVVTTEAPEVSAPKAAPADFSECPFEDVDDELLTGDSSDEYDSSGWRCDDPLAPEAVRMMQAQDEESRLDQVRMYYERRLSDETHLADQEKNRADFYREQVIREARDWDLAREVLAAQRSFNSDSAETIRELTRQIQRSQGVAHELMRLAAEHAEALRPALAEIAIAYPWLKGSYYAGIGVEPGTIPPDGVKL